MADDQQGRILRPQPFAQGTGYGARHDQPGQVPEQPERRAQREAAPEAQGHRRGEPEGARQDDAGAPPVAREQRREDDFARLLDEAAFGARLGAWFTVHFQTDDARLHKNL